MFLMLTGVRDVCCQTCQSMLKKTPVSPERLFPHPACLPSHVAQLFSTSHILHKAYVWGQFSKQTEPIYCSLNLVHIWPWTFVQFRLNYMDLVLQGEFFKHCMCYEDNASPSGNRKTVLLQ